MSVDANRLRDAARLARKIPQPGEHRALFGAVADWLESTARRCGYSDRGVDLDHASRVADAILVSATAERLSQVEAPRGFRVGDLVEIAARDGEGERTPPGLRLIGRTGVVTEADDSPEYPIGISVGGFLGPVWCNPGEIRHADAADCPSCRGTGSHQEPDPGDGEFESDRECLDCDGTGRVIGSASSVVTAGSAL